MKPLDAFFRVLQKILISSRWKREGPGKVVESMSPEIREALSHLKSDEISGDKIRNEDCCDTIIDYGSRQKILEYEKRLGIQPPPRKKYDEHG